MVCEPGTKSSGRSAGWRTLNSVLLAKSQWHMRHPRLPASVDRNLGPVAPSDARECGHTGPLEGPVNESGPDERVAAANCAVEDDDGTSKPMRPEEHLFWLLIDYLGGTQACASWMT